MEKWREGEKEKVKNLMGILCIRNEFKMRAEPIASAPCKSEN